ncbi:MAG TPA: NosD domain-containing protein [Nitrospirota bacterium]
MRSLLISSVLALLFAAGCASVESRVEAYKPGVLAEKSIGLVTIDKDTTWSGNIRVTGDVLVKEGATLTVLPGTFVRFDTIENKLASDGGGKLLGTSNPYFPGAEIIVRGRILAVGTPDQPITFTSADPQPRPGIWGAINLLGTNGNVIEYCHIYYAYNAVHNHSSSVAVLNCVLSNNGTAIIGKKEDYDNPVVMFIEHNTIVGNKSGISIRYGKIDIAFNRIADNEFYGMWLRESIDARVQYNDITGNGKGIYLYKAPPLKINYNNIYANKEYNIGMAEENPSGVDAAENWWGTTDVKAVRATLFDKEQDETLGVINVEPVMAHKILSASEREICVPVP